MNITENYIGYDALVSYLIKVSYSTKVSYSIESKNRAYYYEFLSLNQDIIISSLNSLTNSSLALDLNKWQNFNLIWYNRSLNAAKKLFEPDIFNAVKYKIIKELYSKKNFQIFWQKIIKLIKKKNSSGTLQSDLPKKTQEVIKECDKKNLILAKISQPDTLLPKKTSKNFIKNHSETLQPDIMNITENYIGYDALVSYLMEVSYSIKSKNQAYYYGFLNFNQDIIISSLNSLTNSSLVLDLNKWQIFNLIWYNRFLSVAKSLFEPDIFNVLKNKIITERYSKKIFQIFWQKIIKKFNKKKNFSGTLQLAEQSDILQPEIN
ncbi:hypothetical protein C1646_764109 [Rhizophagus diaphanus]|nr:hypothetical protein C1646_764109 [Rhizophagus diaphanus] [Rhizophagus sp. MUCL 43196]